MQIKSIEIQNYRGIQQVQVNFEKGINLLIGNNGAGKTSLLTAIGIALSAPLQWIPKAPTSRLSEMEDVAYMITNVIGEGVVQTEPQYPVIIKSIINLEGSDYSTYHVKENAVDQAKSKDYDLYEYYKDNFGKGNCGMPLLCFLRAGREKTIKQRAVSVQLATGEVERIRAYQGSFDENLNFADIQNWCVQMEFSAFQRKQELPVYAAFKSIVNRFISLMDEEAIEPQIYYSSIEGAIVYFDGKKELPIHMLSAGYQAIICMIIELAYRAAILNPGLKDIASNTEGVVLIDEIDMHLHPAWQWKILNALKKTFPKVQFIIATHSPVILSSANDAALFLMSDPNNIIRVPNAYGYTINEVLTLRQGTSNVPKEISEYYDEAERLLDGGDEKGLDALLKKAEIAFKDSSDVLNSFKEFVEINRWVEDA